MKGYIDMTGVKEQGDFVLLPEGKYWVEIIDKKDKTTEGGDPMVSIKMIVSRGTYQDEAWVWDNIVFPGLGSPAEKIKGRTKRFLHAIGEPHEGEIDWDSDRWIGKEVQIEVKHEAPNTYHKFIKPYVANYIIQEAEENPSEESPL